MISDKRPLSLDVKIKSKVIEDGTENGDAIGDSNDPCLKVIVIVSM